MRRGKQINEATPYTDMTPYRDPAPYTGPAPHAGLTPRPACSLSVVLGCHPAYLHLLPAALAAINAQSEQPVQRIILMDGGQPAEIPEAAGWEWVCTPFLDPNKARNAVLPHLKTEWVIYYDCDNVMPRDYIRRMKAHAEKVEPSVAFIYPHIIRIQADGFVTWDHQVKPFDYWYLRKDGVVDTSSCWRVRALFAVGWTEGLCMLDDYAVMIKLTRNGWKGKAAEDVFSVLTAHGENRSNNQSRLPEDCYLIRSMAVVTLCSGREIVFKVLDWMMEEEWPHEVHFHFLDDSGSASFHARLCDMASRLPGRGVHVIKANANRWAAHHTDNLHRHLHVADLYNQVLPALRDEIVLTVEDDVIPPRGAAREICRPLLPYRHDQPAACAGIYPSRNAPEYAALSMSGGRNKWLNDTRVDTILPAVQKVGMIPGGFTAWNGWALQRALPFTVTHLPNNSWLGWDGTACMRLRDEGHSVYAHGGIKCRHEFDAV